MIDPADIERIRRSQRARQSTVMGEQAQLLIGHLLVARGLELVERIETGVKVVRAWNPAAGRRVMVGARPTSRVSGDWRASVPGSARTVLIEVKKRIDDQLSLADFEEHQLDALDLYHAKNALALVGWVHSKGPEILEWPIAGLVDRHPLNRDDDRVVAARWKGIR